MAIPPTCCRRLCGNSPTSIRGLSTEGFRKTFKNFDGNEATILPLFLKAKRYGRGHGTGKTLLPEYARLWGQSAESRMARRRSCRRSVRDQLRGRRRELHPAR